MRNALFILPLLMAITSFSSADPNIKEPNVSGAFYDADPKKLAQEIDVFVNRASLPPLDQPIEMIISPHAGYVYSGPVAAHSYKAIRETKYKTIVIIAPSHFFPFDGVSIWKQGGFKTPFGVAQVDEEFAEKLIAQHEKFYFDPKVYQREHSLEVQIPFLQKNYDQFKIVPILMGQPTYSVCEALANALRELIGDRKDVLIVISTDMSHYHDDAFAREMDNRTMEAVKALDARKIWTQCQLGKMEMCGFVPVTTAMIYAKQKGLQPHVLNYANSGDVTGDKSSVVGYFSVAFTSGDAAQNFQTEKSADMPDLTMTQKKRLIQIARETMEEYVNAGRTLDVQEADPRLSKQEGAFVTIHKKGQLRGCIGNIIGQGPLYKTVRDMAISSATQDPRFKPVNKEELKDLEVEVSVLSEPRRIADVNEIQMDVHGVIIKRGPFNQGVFLPQVATETGWNREEFLNNLCAQKAGLPADAWKDPETQIYIFSANVFSEKDVKSAAGCFHGLLIFYL